MSRPRTKQPTLRSWQEAGVRWFAQLTPAFRGILADGMGMGKTGTALSTLKRHRLWPALVVCPVSVLGNWQHDEAAMWCPGVSATQLLPNADNPRAHLNVVSWDALAGMQEDLIARRFRVVIFDEGHYAKNPDAQRSQAAFRVSQSARGCFVLSGTPLVNIKAELHQMHRIVSGRDEPVGAPPLLRRLLEDYAKDVPDKTRVRIPVELDAKIMKEYRKIEEQFGPWLATYLQNRLEALGVEVAEDEAVDNRLDRALKAEALVKIGYLRRLVGVGKIGATVNLTHHLVTSMAEPTVVFAEHDQVLDGIQRRLRRRRIQTVRIDGSTPKKRRHTIVKRFQAGDVPVLLASQAAREGITLTRAAWMVFAERWWTPAAEEQAEDRIHRMTQTRPSWILYPHATGTFDDRIAQIVDVKRQLVDDEIGAALTEQIVGKRPPKLDANLLPRRNRIRAFLFARDRFSPKRVAQWMKLNRYRNPDRGARVGNVFLVEVRPARAFVKGSVQERPIAPGIRALVGTPKPRTKRR
jgi:SNF2 family DNA or RNA helicase